MKLTMPISISAKKSVNDLIQRNKNKLKEIDDELNETIEEMRDDRLE
jgi:polyhydroxyalkanoate synthesis regulator phasin